MTNLRDKLWSLPIAVLGLFMVLVAQSATAARAEFSLEPVPAWVVPIRPNLNVSSPADQISSGVYYLLHDMQVRLEGNERITYRHVAMQAINQRALENVSQIEVRFDPSYQTLILHAISIHRGGKRTDKLKADAVKVLQREKELEYLVYDGSKTANVVLDDVQVGDVVEYAYSLRGSNPVFAGRHAGRFELQWSVPVHQVHASLELPATRLIAIKKRNAPGEPTVTEGRGQRRYEWSNRDVAGLAVDSDAPGWYDPYAAVEWSEFADWGAVAKWAVPLYQPTSDAPSVDAVVNQIKGDRRTSAEQVVEALRYVQREIRYLSVAVGAGSHAPSQPSKVLERRFGDCKDKSLLLVAILRRLGVSASVALVNTTTQRGVNDSQPSPLAFNHVLVRVQMPDRTLWIDPTRWMQGGTINSIFQQDYGYALVIDGETDKLTRMFPDATSVPRAVRNVSTVIDAHLGFTVPVQYTVTSTYEGGSADSIRSTLNTLSRDDLHKQYLSFYDGFFPGIKQTAKLTVQDELDANRIVVREFYEIPEFWKLSEVRKRREAFVRVPDVENLLKAPRVTNRTAPLGMSHPIELLHSTEVLLPEKWEAKPSDTKIDGPAFEFERRVEHRQNDKIVFRDRFASRADEVSVAELPKYLTGLTKAREEVDYLLTRSGEGHDGGSSLWERINWLIVLLSVAMIAAWLWIAIRAYRLDPRPQPGPQDPSLNGIRGWLWLVGFGILTTPVRIAHNIWQTLPSFSVDSWASLTTRTGEAYHPLWAPVLLAELGLNIGLLMFSIVLVVVFVKKRSSLPNFYIALGAASLIINAIDLVVGTAIPAVAEKIGSAEWATQGGAAVSLAIWATYLKRSVRVRSTFVNTYETLVVASSAAAGDVA